jgi:hypothetical protein
MKNRLLLAVIVLALLVPVIAIAMPASDGADTIAAPNFGIKGWVADTTEKPKSGVTVTIYYRGTYVDSRVTEGDGSFLLTTSYNTNLTISFEEFGNKLISCPNTTVQPGTDVLILNLSSSLYNSADRTYTITSLPDGKQCAIMSVSNGKISGIISYEKENGDKVPVRKVDVSITKIGEEGTYKTVQTNEKGYYMIDCPVGGYTLTAGGEGFEKIDPIEINVATGEQTIHMTIVKSDLPKHLGMDIAHLLMLLGVMVGIILAVVAWFLSRRMNDPDHIEIFDDRAEEEEDINNL